MDLVAILFFVALFFNARAAFKLALDWRGMWVTTRFVREAYACLGDLPAEEQLERDPAAPVFLHLVPAYQEPDIAGTVRALGTAVGFLLIIAGSWLATGPSRSASAPSGAGSQLGTRSEGSSPDLPDEG